MSYKVDTIANFERQAKKLIKKYRSLKAELATLIEQLEDKPMQGTDLGNGVYKIRLAIASKGKGKSGGARVITLVRVVQEKVYLISILRQKPVGEPLQRASAGTATEGETRLSNSSPQSTYLNNFSTQNTSTALPYQCLFLQHCPCVSKSIQRTGMPAH